MGLWLSFGQHGRQVPEKAVGNTGDVRKQVIRKLTVRDEHRHDWTALRFCI